MGRGQGGLTSGYPDGMVTPEEAERQHTLRTATARFDDLRLRDTLGADPLNRDEALELLALGEVIARKASYGRQITVRSARTAGASWTQIGAALGTTKQAAWESHLRWAADHDPDGTPLTGRE